MVSIGSERVKCHHTKINIALDNFTGAQEKHHSRISIAQPKGGQIERILITTQLRVYFVRENQM